MVCQKLCQGRVTRSKVIQSPDPPPPLLRQRCFRPKGAKSPLVARWKKKTMRLQWQHGLWCGWNKMSRSQLDITRSHPPHRNSQQYPPIWPPKWNRPQTPHHAFQLYLVFFGHFQGFPSITCCQLRSISFLGEFKTKNMFSQLNWLTKRGPMEPSRRPRRGLETLEGRSVRYFIVI